MPAIQPARLKTQSAEIASQFNNPERFVRSLHLYLDSYADRSHRPGQSRKHPSLINAYNVQAPVIKQVVNDLEPLAFENPSTALELIDVIWQQPYLEFREISAFLLGFIAKQSPGSVIERINIFITPDLGDLLVNWLFIYGLSEAHQFDPQSVYELIDKWISSEDPFFQKIGIKALLSVAKQEQSKYLPKIYKIIQPYIRVYSQDIFPDLKEIVEVLALQSPQETSHFLQQTLEMTGSKDTALLIRQCIEFFPGEIQDRLKIVLRKHRS